MIVSKPDWIFHSDGKNRKLNLFTLAVNLSGTRLATGGIDSEIKIWNVAVMIKEALRNPVDPQEPKLLCTLKQHTGTIMCLRWSPHQDYLASASDDSHVIIWRQEPNSGNNEEYDQLMRSLGSSKFGVFGHEKYEMVKRLSLHQSDVTGLAWAPSQKYLASCGVDNMVYVWETDTFQCFKKLQGHHGLVKGLDWDPRDKYIASHSDDHFLYLWNTKTWTLETRIKGNVSKLKPSGGSTYVQRPSWSPNGNYLCISNSFNSNKPVARLVKRTGWDANLSLVGHVGNIEAVKFNPNAYAISNTDQNVMYCAVGSMDKSLSIWRTGLELPLVVIQDLFDHSVMDLDWTGDGRHLLACSYDGTIALVCFEEGELGSVCHVDVDESSNHQNTILPTYKDSRAQRTTIDKQGKKRIQPQLISAGTKRTRELALIEGCGKTETKRIVVPVPERRTNFVVKLAVGERYNAHVAGNKLSLVADKVIEWTDILPGDVSLVCGNDRWIAAATMDEFDGHKLHLLSASGRKLLPPLVLESSISFLSSNDDLVMACTTLGNFYLWNVLVKKLVSRFQLMASVRPETVVLRNVSISSNGVPMIFLSNKKAYMYNTDLDVWMDCSLDAYYPSDFVRQAQAKMSSSDLLQSRVPGRDFMELLERKMEAGSRLESQEDQDNITLAHLEHQLAISQLLGSKDSYLKWLKLYAKKCSDTRSMWRLKELLAALNPQLLDIGDPVVSRYLEQDAGNITDISTTIAQLGLDVAHVSKEICRLLKANPALECIVPDEMQCD